MTAIMRAELRCSARLRSNEIQIFFPDLVFCEDRKNGEHLFSSTKHGGTQCGLSILVLSIMRLDDLQREEHDSSSTCQMITRRSRSKIQQKF